MCGVLRSRRSPGGPERSGVRARHVLGSQRPRRPAAGLSQSWDALSHSSMQRARAKGPLNSPLARMQAAGKLWNNTTSSVFM